MQERFGQAYEKVDPAVKKVRSEFMRRFETYKHMFDGAEERSGEDPLVMEIPLAMEDVDESLLQECYHKRDKLVRLTR